MSLPVVSAASGGSDGGDRSQAAWELIRTVRTTAMEFIPTVDDAVFQLTNLYAEPELQQADPAFPLALSVMMGVLSGLHLAAEVLDWLDTGLPVTNAAVLPRQPGVRVVEEPEP